MRVLRAQCTNVRNPFGRDVAQIDCCAAAALGVIGDVQIAKIDDEWIAVVDARPAAMLGLHQVNEVGGQAAVVAVAAAQIG